MKYIQKDIHYSITKKEQGILKIRRKYNNLSGCRTLSLFTYTTFYVFSEKMSQDTNNSVIEYRKACFVTDILLSILFLANLLD